MIPAPDFKDRLIGPVMTDGIIKGLLEVARFRRIQDQVASIAHLFRGEGGQEKLWNYVREHIKYVTDPIGKQFLQHPKLLWFRKLGDCKSMTLFVSAVLQALNIPHLIRFTKYSTKSAGFTHVYCVVDGVPIDTVWHTYGTEKRYLAKKDYHIMTELHEVSGPGVMDIDAYISGLEEDFRLSGLDYETEVHGLNTDHLEAIVRIPQEIAGLDEIDGFGSMALSFGKKALMPGGFAMSAGKKLLNSGAANKIKGAVQKVIKKLAGPLLDKLMTGLTDKFGEYFLFMFIRQEWQIGAVKTRIEGQRKLLAWFGRVTNKKEDQLLPMIKKGIEKKYGMPLKDLFVKELSGRLSGRGVPGIGWLVVVTTVMKYLPTIVDQVGKFIGESAPVKNLQANASNMDVLAQELEKAFPKKKQDPKPKPPFGGGGGGQPVGGDRISLPPDQRGNGTNNGGGGTGGNNNRNNGDQTPIDDNNDGNTKDNNGNTKDNNGSDTKDKDNKSTGMSTTTMVVGGALGLGLLALAMNSGKGSKRKK
jgi:hypothetical protein